MDKGISDFSKAPDSKKCELCNLLQYKCNIIGTTVRHLYRMKINSYLKFNPMKTKLLKIVAGLTLLSIPTIHNAQVITLGTAANFVLFSSNGPVSNTGISHLTGNVGTNMGSSTAFGNVDGQMHDQDGTSAQSSTDLLIAYNQLNSATPAFFPSNLLGNGQVLTSGTYSIGSSATLNLDLTLDAQGSSSAVFIFQIQGSFSTNASSKIKLINGAQACNVYWKVEGLVSMASGTTMRGNVIANNAAINMNTGDTLEGRAFSTTGAITVNGVLAYKPIGCGSTVLTGPTAPNLGAAACYAIFSSNGAVSNSGNTYATGDVGSNNGSATGFNPLFVTGTIHPIPDGSTAQCASDLLVAYNYVNALPFDIELLYPAQFGNNLVLTPHTYRMNGAASLTDTLFLNAQGNANAVFVIQIQGALTTSTYSKILLKNGALAKNVYWKIEGAVSINDYSIFRGTIICNNGALGALNTGVVFDGRALTTTGALTTTSITITAQTIPSNCATVGVPVIEVSKESVHIYPNPFTTLINVTINDLEKNNNGEIIISNILGEEVMRSAVSKQTTALETSHLSSGIYFYKIVSNNKTIQSGKLIAQ